MKKTSKSSKRWLKEHFDDHFVKKSQAEGYRSRAAYKLIEIQEKDKLIKQGMRVADLGAAPGSWAQLLTKWVGSKGNVVAMDLLAMDAVTGVDFLQGDFLEDAVLAQLTEMLNGEKLDVIVSDMAPNTSGIKETDQSRSMLLCEYAMDFVQQQLRGGGSFLVKTFQGEGWDAYLKLLRQAFIKVVVRKPEASRGRSREVYLLARGFRADNSVN